MSDRIMNTESVYGRGEQRACTDGPSDIGRGMEPPIPPYPNRMRDISITQLDRGYVVRVGCQSLAIESKEVLLEKLISYINNPDEAETRYNKGEFFK